MYSKNDKPPLPILLHNEQQNLMVRSWSRDSEFEIEYYYNIDSFLRAIESKSALLVLIHWDTQKSDQSASRIAQVRDTVSEQIGLVVLADSNPEEDAVAALQTGADQFINMEFSVKVVDELIKALLRRIGSEYGFQLFPPYCINQMTREVIFADQRIQLTPREFRIVQYLFDNNDQVLSREALLRDIWELPNLEHPRRVDTKMSHVRKKICLDGSYGWELQYPRGMGYKLISDAEIKPAAC